MPVSFVAALTAGGFYDDTSPSFTPETGGNYLLFQMAGSAGVGFSPTGTEGTWDVIPGSVNNDSGGDEVGFAENVSPVTVAQTVTYTRGGFGISAGILEYAGVDHSSDAAYLETDGAGTGTGSIVGTPVTVPIGSVLVAYCFCITNGGIGMAPGTGGTQRDVTAIFNSWIIADWAGTGGTVTPSFTPASAGENFGLLQVVLNPASSGNMLTASLSESGAAADTLTSSWAGTVELVDGGTATDTLMALAHRFGAIAEAGAAVGTVQALRTASAALEEAASAVDALTALLVHTSEADAAGAAQDALSAMAALLVSIAEAGAALDHPNAMVVHGIPASIAETASAQDSVTAAGQQRTASVAEAGSAVDALTKSLAAALHYLDFGNAQDALTSTAHLAVALAEAGHAVDVVTNVQHLAAALVDAGAAVDLVTALVGSARFGPSFVTVRRLTQSTLTMVANMTPIPGQLVIEEGAACQGVASFVGSDGNPFTPVSAQYRVDEVATGTSIVPWTDLNVTGPQAVITVTAEQNMMVNATRMHEVRQVAVQLTDSAGDVDVLPPAFYAIRRLVRGQQ